MLTADENGKIEGKFNIPQRVPAGTKRVEFFGDKGSKTQTTYTGSHEITVKEYQRLTTITSERYDPLAQTFTLSESRHLVGVDLWFIKKGRSGVRVQIRETTVGLPNQNILGESILSANEITIEKGQKTSFRFSPLFAEAGVEYAIVVLTDDPEFEVAIAEIGGRDKSRGIVKSQPYQVGVLLSSSNASTWTPHQSIDLTFKLLAAKFKNPARTIDLGELDMKKVSDLDVLAMVHRPVSETDVRFSITEAEGQERKFEIQDDQILQLSEQLGGKVSVKAHLSGSKKHSPILFPGTQLAQGHLERTANYISRIIPCGKNSTIKLCFDAVLPPEASVEVFVEEGNKWLKLTLAKGTLLDEEWIEQKFEHKNFKQSQFRVKLNLKGTEKGRPRVRRLRVTAT